LNKLALYHESELAFLQNIEIFFLFFVGSLDDMKICLTNLTEIRFSAKTKSHQQYFANQTHSSLINLSIPLAQK